MYVNLEWVLTCSYYICVKCCLGTHGRERSKAGDAGEDSARIQRDSEDVTEDRRDETLYSVENLETSAEQD